MDLSFSAFDAFKDIADSQDISSDRVHIRVQQRNGRKCITTVQGLAADIDTKRVLKAFKKNFNCNGSTVMDDELGEIIQLSGDQRMNAKSFLVDKEICLEEQIQVHGF